MLRGARQRLLLQNREQCGGYLRLPACFAPLCSNECVAQPSPGWPDIAAAKHRSTQRRFCMQARPVAQRRPVSVAAEQRAVRLFGGQDKDNKDKDSEGQGRRRTRTPTRRRAARRDCPEPRSEPAAAQEGRAGGGRGLDGRGLEITHVYIDLIRTRPPDSQGSKHEGRRCVSSPARLEKVGQHFKKNPRCSLIGLELTNQRSEFSSVLPDWVRTLQSEKRIFLGAP